MKTNEITFENLKFFLTIDRNFSKDQRQDYLDNVLAEKGIYAFISTEEQMDTDKIHVNASRQYILEKFSYVLLIASVGLALMHAFIPASILFVLSFVAIFHAKYWFRNRLERLMFTKDLHIQLNKDLKMLEKVRQDIINEKNQK
jgi:uncharacterized membrane protein